MGILYELLNGSILQWAWNLKILVLFKMAATFVQLFSQGHFTSKYIEPVEISRWRLFSQMAATLVDKVKLYELG